MSRNWSSTLVSMLSGGEVTRCFLIQLNNGITSVVRLTSHDTDQVVGADTFLHSPGFKVTRFSLKNGGSPAGLDIELPFDENTAIRAEDVRRGVWRGAAITIWIADFTDPSDREVLVVGYLGLTEFTDRLAGRIQIITLADALADIILPTIQQKCDFQFCGQRCGVVEATYTLPATVLTVVSNTRFTISVSNIYDLNFSKGKVTWLTGSNAGGKFWVRDWNAATSRIDLVTETPFDIEVGDTMNILAGCKQDRTDCTLYGNEHRFHGFEYVVK